MKRVLVTGMSGTGKSTLLGQAGVDAGAAFDEGVDGQREAALLHRERLRGRAEGSDDVGDAAFVEVSRDSKRRFV